jgi:hypothetical protein
MDDEKKIRAELKAIERSFKPWLPVEQRNDLTLTTRWIRRAKRIKRKKAIPSRKRGNTQSYIKTTLKTARGLQQKRITWTRGRCLKEIRGRFIVAGAARERYFKKIMDSLSRWPERHPNTPYPQPYISKLKLVQDEVTGKMIGKVYWPTAFSAIKRLGDKAPGPNEIEIDFVALRLWAQDKDSRHSERTA